MPLNKVTALKILIRCLCEANNFCILIDINQLYYYEASCRHCFGIHLGFLFHLTTKIHVFLCNIHCTCNNEKDKSDTKKFKTP